MTLTTVFRSAALPTVLCVGDAAVFPLYSLLTLTALASTVTPLLRNLSSHGKTRLRLPSDGTAPNAKGRRRSILEGDAFLVGKRRFLHFYVVGIASTLTLAFLMNRPNDASRFGPAELSTVLLLVHLVRRCYECLYVHCWDSNACGQMHVAGYILGLLHYAILPFVFFDCGDWCCELLGPASAKDFTTGAETKDARDEASLLSLGVFICVAMILWAQYEQHYDHRILAGLRQKRHDKGEGGMPRREDPSRPHIPEHYFIPYGRLFRYVSCPHYLAEIVLYLGFAILLATTANSTESIRCQISSSLLGELKFGYASGTIKVALDFALNLREYKGWALLAWVATNLSISAARSHAWYLQKFGSVYPSERKALVPFIR